jgi:hypothetical protein
MASEYVEYEFTLADGSTVYEMVERCDAARQMHMFMSMHKAKAARPIELSAETVGERQRRLDAALEMIRQQRFLRRPPQELDTSALPLFGDQSRQAELF